MDILQMFDVLEQKIEDDWYNSAPYIRWIFAIILGLVGCVIGYALLR